MEIVKAVQPASSLELMSQVVETKLSRTELLDLIVGKVAAEVDAKARSINQEIKDLEEEMSVSLSIAIKLLRARASDVTVEVNERSRWDGGDLLLTAKVKITKDDLPKKYLEAEEALKLKRQELYALHAQARKLKDSKQRARLEMLKQSLESTPEGRRVLDVIDELKNAMKDRLLESGKTVSQ